jgi:hypothetical protein
MDLLNIKHFLPLETFLPEFDQCQLIYVSSSFKFLAGPKGKQDRVLVAQ